MLNVELEKYLESHTSNEDNILKLLDRETNLKTTLPRMLSGKVQGKFLELISKMVNPKRILEIGTFTGYSAICLSKGLKLDGQLITIESNEELEDIIRKYIDLSGLSHKINLIIGDALVEIPKLDNKFDLAFIDANKEQYVDYYLLVKEKLRPGGFIIVDNVLWNGKVIKNENSDKETLAIQNFNNYIINDKDIEQVMIPIRDGLLLIRKLF